MDSCTLTADITGRQRLWSATQRKLVVPHYRLNSSIVDALLLQACRLVIRCLTVFVLQNCVLTLSNVRALKTYFSRNIDDKMYSAH